VSHFISIRGSLGLIDVDVAMAQRSANEPFAIDWLVMTANRVDIDDRSLKAKTAWAFGIWRGYFQSEPPA
jgi:hypothetical protein